MSLVHHEHAPLDGAQTGVVHVYQLVTRQQHVELQLGPFPDTLRFGCVAVERVLTVRELVLSGGMVCCQLLSYCWTAKFLGKTISLLFISYFRSLLKIIL
jgi:hypothetical protein